MPEPDQIIQFLVIASIFGGVVWGVMSRRMRGSRWYLYASLFCGVFVMVDVSLMYHEHAGTGAMNAAIGWCWMPILLVTFLLTHKSVPAAKEKSN